MSAEEPSPRSQEWLEHASHAELISTRAHSLPRRDSGDGAALRAEVPRLRHLAFAVNRITGELPLSLGTLCELQVLCLEDNLIEGPILPQLDRLTQLQVLDLSCNQFVGDVPDGITKLPVLRNLTLRGNKLAISGNWDAKALALRFAKTQRIQVVL